MCLSKVFEKNGGEEKLLLTNIQRIRFDKGELVFSDLLENETRIRGRLLLCDLTGGKIVVEPSDS